MTEQKKESSQKFDSKLSEETDSDLEISNLEQEKIINWLKKVKFRKKFFGGVDEQDVWKKIQELNEMYEAALKVERIRYDVLLQEQTKKNETNLSTDQPSKESSSYE